MRTVRPVPSPLERPIRLGVLISGGGTTLANFLTRMKAGALDAEIPLVLADHPGCGGITRAKQAGLQCEIISRQEYLTVESFSEVLFDRLRLAHVDLVLLAGFLSLIRIPDDFAYRTMNIHPALIPAFCGRGYYGEKVHRSVIERGVKVSGCTVHFADNQYDHGPIIVQKSVPVFDDDTPATLAARVFKAECEAYPEAIGLFASGRIEIADHRVRLC